MEILAGARRSTGDLDSMLARGYIRVLVPYNHTFFFYEGARIHGLAYEFMERFAETLRRDRTTTRRRLTMLYLPVPRDQLLPQLEAGYGDVVMAGLTVFPERERKVEFVPHPRLRVSELVVTGPGAPAIATLEDLAGQEVFVRPSSSYAASLAALDARLQAAGRPGIRIVPADERLETEDILELVNAGAHPVTVADDYLARFWDGMLPGLRVREDLVLRAGAPFGPAVRRDSPRLAAALRRFQRTAGAGTEFGNIVFCRYLEQNPWVRDPHSGADRARLERTLPLFHHYAERYAFDPLLLVAQGYQESRLDQTLRSRAGAVGIMQIKPSTAAGPPIGIRGVERDADRNIHAGVKYLRHLSDTYFAEPGIDDHNRQLFAIAAYNAGPARIRGLRAKAAARGLDADVWFHNVEIVSAREIGRENYQYVRNILKYWIAYQLAAGGADSLGVRNAAGRMRAD
jgi:membrane-bound lytic murein transglycosylase MltF